MPFQGEARGGGGGGVQGKHQPTVTKSLSNKWKNYGVNTKLFFWFNVNLVV